MSTSFRRHTLVLLLDVGVLLLGITGIRSLDLKASLPVAIEAQQGRLIVTDVLDSTAAGAIRHGDALVALDDHTLHATDEVEFLMDARPVGSRVTATVERANYRLDAEIRAVRFYGDFYIAIVALASLLFFVVGIFVFLKRPQDAAAWIYHLGSLGGVILLANTTTFFPPEPGWLDYLSRTAFYCSYLFVPAIFFHFATMFPHRRWPARSWGYGALYAVVLILGAGASASFFHASSGMTLDDFRPHASWFTAIRWMLIVMTVAGLWMFRQAFATATEESERRKLRWIFWGLFVGFAPFLFLWVLPQIILSRGLVPEEVPMLATGCIPVAFGFAIVKYHALDIDVLFHRSIEYGSVMAVFLLLYVTVVGLVAGIASSTTSNLSLLLSGVIAVTVALLFEPTRRLVHHVVDRRYFRVRYDYREAERIFLTEMKKCVSVQEIASLLVRKTDELIPVERIGLFALKEPEQWLQTISHRGFDLFERHRIRFHPEDLRTSLELPVALDDLIEPGVRHESADVRVFRKWGLALVLTMLSQNLKFLGFLVLGPKRSGTRFGSEDVDLLSTVVMQAGLEVERITLQEELLRKETEARTLRALNDVKSEFVSYVSHELKTPLTSIKMFAQLLQGKAQAKNRAQEYLHIIEGEADRLNRMVTTILESAKIEKGVKQYVFRRVDLSAIVQTVVKNLHYMLHKHGFRVDVIFPPARGRKGMMPAMVEADADAIAEVLINLLSNAIKYSVDEKVIEVRVRTKKGWAQCSVKDKGRGIPADILPHIFEKFYRQPGVSTGVEGVGLGLSVVKHIVEAHGGRIEVESRVGRGSTFCVYLPLAPRQLPETQEQQ